MRFGATTPRQTEWTCVDIPFNQIKHQVMIGIMLFRKLLGIASPRDRQAEQRSMAKCVLTGKKTSFGHSRSFSFKLTNRKCETTWCL
jgi:hypothetical protein